MRPLLSLLFLFFIFNASSQDTTGNSSLNDAASAGKTFTSINIPATFPGGKEAWKKFLEKRLRPSTAAEHKAPPGIYTVLVSFVIDTSGTLTKIHILQDPGYGTADDVMRIFKKSPKWIPATQNGRKVLYTQKQNFYYQVNEN